MKSYPPWHVRLAILAVVVVLGLGAPPGAGAQPLPGGSLDPLTIPKYVTPLVIPPVMPKSTSSPTPSADYDIAVRQFKQQILPGGIWGGSFPATTIWSYGRAEDPVPDSSAIGGGVGIAPAPNSSFNYPAFTVENSSGVPTSVRWINDLVDPVTGNFLPHLFSIDQTLHWANPTRANCVVGDPNRTDCHTELAAPYAGPVPLVTHVHGAHVQPESDGYPEAWWLPGAPGTKGIPTSYAGRGSVFTQANNANAVPGSAWYSYENSQPATTLWYHDHALGMTRLNVYAGPAGFWLVRGGTNDLPGGILPGPAPSGIGDPNFNAAYRATIREIPIAIQDRSFNTDGSLFYPDSRSFFDTFAGPYIGVDLDDPSDISGIWNPEAFFNTMVVNGTTWPKYEVAPARYRLRLLDGCNSRALNLSMFVVSSDPDGIPGNADDVLGAELPFYQIGAEQGFLPKVVKIQTGMVTTLPGNGTTPAGVPTDSPQQALLMGPAERADVIVDFSGLTNGTRIRMINTAPDAPFGGFPDTPADALTTGQVMEFIVNGALIQPNDATTTAPENLVLPVEGSLGVPDSLQPRQVSLNEMVSDQVCVEIDTLTGAIITRFSVPPGDPTFPETCRNTPPLTPGNIVDVAGPRQARLGILGSDPGGNLFAMPMMWGDPITETPAVGSTEIWEIYNATEDAHPIHLHLVRFQVVEREDLDATNLLAGIFTPTGIVTPPHPNELGYKDTVVAYPGQVTRIKAKFDIPGLYVWHCHIVEHEDNEMMRSFVVTTPAVAVSLAASESLQSVSALAPVTFTAQGRGIVDGNPTGSSGFQYRFSITPPGGGSPIVMRDWGAQPGEQAAMAPSWTWTPPAVQGSYLITVDARQVGSTNPAGETSASLTFEVVGPPPVVTTDGITSIAPTTAVGQGTVASDGGMSTLRGFCWSMTPNPVLSGAGCVYSGVGTGSFTGALTGLAANTLYHVRAFAESSAGVAYGTDLTFVTPPPAPTGLTVTPAFESVRLSWSGSADPAVTGYRIHVQPANGAELPTIPVGNVTSFTVTGLTANVTYFFAVSAVNSGGAESAIGSYVSALPLSTHSLSLSFTGDGGGLVLFVDQAITCTGACTTRVSPGASVTLRPNPDQFSTFAGWSGACTNSSGDCTFTLTGDTSVAARFNRAASLGVLVPDTSTKYATILAAYQGAPDGADIRAFGTTFTENILFDRNKYVAIRGGYDALFATVVGATTIKGTVTLQNGSVVLDTVTIL